MSKLPTFVSWIAWLCEYSARGAFGCQWSDGQVTYADDKPKVSPAAEDFTRNSPRFYSHRGAAETAAAAITRSCEAQEELDRRAQTHPEWAQYRADLHSYYRADGRYQGDCAPEQPDTLPLLPSLGATG